MGKYEGTAPGGFQYGWLKAMRAGVPWQTIAPFNSSVARFNDGTRAKKYLKAFRDALSPEDARRFWIWVTEENIKRRRLYPEIATDVIQWIRESDEEEDGESDRASR